jgi:hypothetical protein
MRDPPRNEGITVTGGSFKAGAVAVGRGARATQNITGSAAALEDAGHHEIAELLRRLTELIEQHAGDLERPEELLESTATVAQEVAGGQPNRVTLRALLAGIAEAAGSVTSVAAAVEALQHAVAGVL